MSKPEPIKVRIARALCGQRKTYWEVLHEVFPRELFPRAMNPSSNGGPPGCAMAFGRALREMGIFDCSLTGYAHGVLYLSEADAKRWIS